MIVVGMPEIECKIQDYIEGCNFGLVCSCTIVCTLGSFVLGSMSVSCSDKMLNKACNLDTIDSWAWGCRKVLNTDNLSMAGMTDSTQMLMALGCKMVRVGTGTGFGSKMEVCICFENKMTALSCKTEACSNTVSIESDRMVGCTDIDSMFVVD